MCPQQNVELYFLTHSLQNSTTKRFKFPYTNVTQRPQTRRCMFKLSSLNVVVYIHYSVLFVNDRASPHKYAVEVASSLRTCHETFFVANVCIFL